MFVVVPFPINVSLKGLSVCRVITMNEGHVGTYHSIL